MCGDIQHPVRCARRRWLRPEIALLLALGIAACGARDSASEPHATTSTASDTGSSTLATRATRRPQRYPSRIVGTVALFGFREDGSGAGWGAYFRVNRRLPLGTNVERNRYTLVLRDPDTNKVLSDSDPLNRISGTRPGTACYLADFDATSPLPLGRAHDIDRVRVSLERLGGKPLGTSSVQLAAPQMRPVFVGGNRDQGERKLRQSGCLR